MPGRLERSKAYYQTLSSIPGKKLWSSEEMSTPATAGGSRCLAKLLNRNFIDANLTSSIVWSIIYAWYTDLACSGQGLIWAPEPWSGKIGVVDSVWSAAHTTQFTEVGWRYSQQGTGSGYLPATTAAEHHLLSVTPCSAASQSWRWMPDGSIANAAGRCLSTNGGGRVHTESCDGSAEQHFRPHATMNGHIESVAHPGACLDRNLQAGNIVDTYACCMKPACAQMNEEWILSSVKSGRFISIANGQCVTEDAAVASGGAGSYVALHSPDGKDHTIIIETMINGDSTCDYGNSGWDDIVVGAQPHPVRFCFGFANGTCPKMHLSLFYSNFNQSVRFEEQTPPGLDATCCVALMLQPNSIYTLSTIQTARKGAHPIEAITPVESQAASCGSVAKWQNTTPFALPYTTTFSAAQVHFSDFAEFFADMQGIFRVQADPFMATEAQQQAFVLSQQIFSLAHSTTWGDPFGDPPTTLLGSDAWENYTVAAQLRLPANASGTDFAGVASRHGHGYEFSGIGGYKFGLTARNDWFLNISCSVHTICNATTLAAGTYTRKGDGLREGWQTVSLNAKGAMLTASINGEIVVTVRNTKWGSGYAGLFCGWHASFAKSFTIT
eukprot:SAG31_NODE_4956_length_2836_cov_1.271830_1_plen_610_part_00